MDALLQLVIGLWRGEQTARNVLVFTVVGTVVIVLVCELIQWRRRKRKRLP